MTDLVGHTLGKYQLIERLGRGGMADVYKGYQPGLDRHVAVKVLHPHLSEEPDFITRFQREARSVANLHHPHIVQVFDFDVQDGSYYMVMEYIEGGKTLKEHLQALGAQGQRLPLDLTLDIIAKLADALDYAHGQGMIHRDIKPSNVLMRSPNQPVLGDFGIARIVGQTGLTGSGAMIGTPAYMSPEQGQGVKADERSDIYALGIVLYEMLTGQPPYDADTPYGVILKHINDPITPPHVLIGSLPSAVENIALKSMAKNPEDRFQSAGEMRDAVRRAIEIVADATRPSELTPPQGILVQEGAGQAAATQAAPVMDDGSTLAAKPAAPPPVKAAAKPRRWWIWAGAALAVTVIGGGIAAAAGLLRPGPGPVSTGQTGESTGAAAGTEGALVEQGYEQVWSGEWEAAIDPFNQALELNPDNAEALAGRGMAYIGLWGQENFDAAAADLERAKELEPDNALVNFGLGVLHHIAEGYIDHDAALAEFTKAIEGCGDNAQLCSAAYEWRAGVQAWYNNDLASGIADMDQAIASKPDREDIYDLYRDRAEMKFANDDVAGALADYEKAYEVTGWGEFLERAARFAVQVEDYDKALAYYDQLLEEQAGEPRYLVGKGFVQWKAGDAAAALETADRAITLQPDLLGAHYLRGLLLLEAGQAEDALAEFEPISQAEDDPYSYGFPFLLTDFGYEIYYDMARAAYAMGDPDRAYDLCSQSLERDDWVWPYILQGQILAEKGDIGGARERYLLARDRAYDDPDLEATIDGLLAGLSG